MSPRAAKPTRLPGGGLSIATEPDFFVKQGDFQSLAAGRPMMFYRDPAKALADWEGGWRDLFLGTFPGSVAAIDAALGFDPEADYEDDEDEEDNEEDGPGAG
jgi:hypothetical protein